MISSEERDADFAWADQGVSVVFFSTAPDRNHNEAQISFHLNLNGLNKRMKCWLMASYKENFVLTS